MAVRIASIPHPTRYGDRSPKAVLGSQPPRLGHSPEGPRLPGFCSDRPCYLLPVLVFLERWRTEKGRQVVSLQRRRFCTFSAWLSAKNMLRSRQWSKTEIIFSGLAGGRRGRLELGVWWMRSSTNCSLAVRGCGAWLNGRPIHVSATSSLDRALLATSLPYDQRERRNFYLALWEAFMMRTQGVRHAGSAVFCSGRLRFPFGKLYVSARRGVALPQL